MSYDDFELSPSESQAFNKGFEAAFNGEDELMDNPYDTGTNEHLSWYDGYRNFGEQQEELARQEHRKLRFESHDSVLARLRGLPMVEVAGLVEAKLEDWPGRCFEIASKLVQAAGWHDARAVYGLYLGPISRHCKAFAPAAQATVRHGWIVTREGVILDPTAWVFEAAAPYLKVLQPGEPLHFECHEHYDEGAESLSELARREFPSANDNDTVIEVPDKALYSELRQYVRMRELTAQISEKGFTAAQLGWLCRTPYTRWGTKTAHALYGLVEAAGLRAVIPTDFRARAKREREWGLTC